MANMIFERYEKKYMLNKIQYDNLLNELNDYMTIDSYGKHTICNIYFDTDDYELIRTSIEKPVYKEKLRLRCYGVPDDDSMVFLEIKKKYNGIVYKRRVQIKLSEAMDFLKCGLLPKSVNDNFQTRQILKEITYFINFYNVTPKVYIAYDRIAMYGNEDNDFRITFDTNVRSRENKLDMRAGDKAEKLLDDDVYLMEIKTSGSLPLWMINILDTKGIMPQSFSKYGKIYTDKILPKLPQKYINIHSNKEINKCLQAY